jgi:methyl-accepting chemotaxis protein
MKFIKIFNNLMLSTRIIVLMLMIGLIPLIAVGVMNVISAHSAIYKAEFNLLENLKFAKKDQIEAYFDQVRNQVSVLAENRTIVKAVKQFTADLDALPKDLEINDEKRLAFKKSVGQYLSQEFQNQYNKLNLKSKVDTQKLIPAQDAALAAQYLYISNNPQLVGSKDLLMRASDASRYSSTHQNYHAEFKRYLEKFHLYDMFLIDAQSGNVVYSVYKEIDFATNLNDGPFKDSALAQIYKKALALNSNQQAAIVDISRYRASYDQPASFIGSPVFEGDKVLGVLVFQVPISILNKILNKAQGMGETGEVYLVGKDKLMRSQSRFDSRNTVISTQVDTLATQQLFAENKEIHTMNNYLGKEVISVYKKLTIEGLDWGIVADIETEEALAAINTEITFNLIIGLISVVVVIMVANLFARSIANPLEIAVDIAEKVAKGKLDNNIVANTHCEVGNLLRSLNRMQNNLKQRIEADQKALAENTRIKQALDNISANMLVIDVNNTVVYSNYAMDNFFRFSRKQIESLSVGLDVTNVVGNHTLFELLPSDEQVLNTLLHNENDEKESVCNIQLAQLQITLKANPVLNSKGRRLGTVIEWKDRTLELATEKEVQVAVDKALRGDLSARIEIDGKEGFFANLATSVNQLMAVSEGITNDILHVMEAMAKGDLDQKMDDDYQGVYQQLKHNVNATCDKLKEVVTQIQTSASFVKLGTSEISMATQDLNKRTEEQSASLQQTATSMASINDKMQQNAALSQQARDLVNQSRCTALEGGEAVDLTLKAMIDIEKSSKKIAEVISVIDSISFQINLLALNAAVEAARVGELGRGFGVVASEVRKLASISAESAKEISASITSSNEKVKEGMRLAYESGSKLTEIVGSVNQTAEFVEEIAVLNVEQSNSVGEISTAVSYIDEIAIQNAAMVEQATKASEHLGEQAHQLEKMTSFFSRESLDKLYNTGESVSSETSQAQPSVSYREKSK